MRFLDIKYEHFYNPQQPCGHGSVVERLLPKQNVAGSNPAARSICKNLQDYYGGFSLLKTHVKIYLNSTI